jgi:hypothetical protein
MGGGGTVIERRKTTAWWAFVGHTAEKPPGLVHGFRAGTVQWAQMGQKAGRTGLRDENFFKRKVNGWAAKDIRLN